MSFFFGRARARTNTTDLAKQARDHVTKLEGPQGAAKVNINKIDEALSILLTGSQADELAKVLSQMKQVLQGTQGASDVPWGPRRPRQPR
jgi:calcium binding protein 39